MCAAVLPVAPVDVCAGWAADGGLDLEASGGLACIWCGGGRPGGTLWDCVWTAQVGFGRTVALGDLEVMHATWCATWVRRLDSGHLRAQPHAAPPPVSDDDYCGIRFTRVHVRMMTRPTSGSSHSLMPGCHGTSTRPCAASVRQACGSFGTCAPALGTRCTAAGAIRCAYLCVSAALG